MRKFVEREISIRMANNEIFKNLPEEAYDIAYDMLVEGAIEAGENGATLDKTFMKSYVESAAVSMLHSLISNS